MIGFTGEANTKNPAPYKCLFHAMIEDWRLKWNEGTDGSTDPQFPFGFMQVGLLNFLHIVAQSGVAYGCIVISPLCAPSVTGALWRLLQRG